MSENRARDSTILWLSPRRSYTLEIGGPDDAQTSFDPALITSRFEGAGQ